LGFDIFGFDISLRFVLNSSNGICHQKANIAAVDDKTTNGQRQAAAGFNIAPLALS